MKRVAALLTVLTALFLPTMASAQFLVVAQCPPFSGSNLLRAGDTVSGFIDTAGKLCTAASVTAGATTIASGGVASGAYAAGAFATGAGADGWDTTFGAKADAAAGTGTVTAMAILKQLHLDMTASIPAGTALIGFVSNDPCNQQNVAKSNVSISMQNTTTVKLVSLASAKKIYICSLSLIASGATVFSIADGTKVSTECDTAAEAVIGTTTASHGLSLAANGGISYGNGTGTVAFTNTAAHDLCLFQSGSVDLSGNLTYVQQ